MKSFEEFKQSLSEKAHAVPKTKKEKDLAALAEPKDKITHADVMKGRGVSEDMHYCAKHVYSERFGEGFVVEGSHAEPNEEGLIEWYDVDFGGTVRRVMTEKVKVMHAEYHMNHKKKKMAEEGDCEDDEDMEDEKLEEAKSATHSVYNVTVRRNRRGVRPGIKHHVTTHRVIVARGDDEEKRVKQAVAKHYGDIKHEVTSIVKGQFNRKKPDLNKGIQEASEYVDEEIKKGDFVKDPMGKLHRVFDVKGTTLHTGEYRGDNSYGGNSTLHITKAKKVAKPAEVNEEVEQIDELSKATLGSYIRKAVNGVDGIAVRAHLAGQEGDEALGDKHWMRAVKRGESVAKAVDKLVKSKVNEEVTFEKGDFVKEHPKNVVQKEDVSMEDYAAAIAGGTTFRDVLDEKKLTPAELKKREEIAQAMERENPGMDMGKKMAIATAQAKKVAEEVEQIDEDKAQYRYTGGMHGEYHPTKKQPSPAAHIDAAKFHERQAKIYSKALGKKGGDDEYANRAIDFHTGAAYHHRNSASAMKEEVEELDELSKKTLSNYIKTASRAMHRNTMHGYLLKVPHDRPYSDQRRVAKEKENHIQKSFKRLDGIQIAANKLAKEEVEELDELSKGTLSSYIKKASGEAVQRAHAQTAYRRQADDEPTQPIWREIEKLHNTKKWNRMTGIRKAADKLAEEEADHIDENFVDVEQIVEYEIGQAADGKFYDDEGNEVKRIHRANRRHVMNRNYSYGQDRPYKPGGHYASREQDKSKQTKNEEVGVSYKDFIDRLNNQE